MVNLIPTVIFCPKCGGKVGLKETNEPLEVARLYEAEYSQGARGRCSCGAIIAFLTKPLPTEPTFTVLMDIYR